MPLTGAMAFTDDRCAIGVHRDAYPGDIDGEEGAAVLSC
jgi:hypothetical protein